MGLWNISAWFIAEAYYQSRIKHLVAQETMLAQQRASDLADSIRRNLNYLHGIPDVFSQLLRVKAVAARFGADAVPSTRPLATRIQQWTADPALKDLNLYLALAGKSLNADIIYVVNAAGDAIAASNWNTPGNTVGTNFADRDFFKANQTGERGMQYAVGKTTHIPGLYFSTPVLVNGKFMGAVVAKTDVPNLSFLIKQVDAFVTDANGVIILSRDKALEMRVLPGAAIARVSHTARFARYQRNSFPELNIPLWADHPFIPLLQLGNQTNPHIMISKALPEYGIKVNVDSELGAIPSLRRDYFWFGLLLGALGSLLILVAGSAVLYFQSIIKSRALLWRQANFDTLTSLPNRELFRDRLAQDMKKSDRDGLPLALLLIDIDQFKEVNDTLGHDMGDLLLQEAASRIEGCVRKSDTVARLGGDEFTIILPQLADASDVKDIAHKLIRKLAEPFHLRGEITHVSASLGVTFYPDDAGDIDHLIKNADQAMYAAKDSGRNRFSYFTLSLQEAAQNRLRLTNDLRGALLAGQFRLYFQPIVELASGRVHKAEALLRWLHPLRGMVSPQEFIPLAEETGLIINIGEWVRKESAIWCKRWHAACPDGFQISVNQSPVEFMDDGGSDNVQGLLDNLRICDLFGSSFVIEITEGLLLNDDPRITNKLMALRDAGIQVAIDDFGTGYSSLSYLKKFDIDYLKIDQSFIRNLERDSDDMVLCEAIIVMAHKLGLKVIAEGVETEQQRELLISSGCDYAQGYIFSPPLPAEEFDVWLQVRNQHASRQLAAV